MTASQHPLPSGLGPATTADEVISGIDLTGRIAVVTGGYAGLGLETTRVLAGAGATVVVPARDIDKARRNLAPLNLGDRVEIEAMDLIDPASVAAFAGRFLASGRPLHLLINNAGVMFTPLTRDADGHESQFATNHLGHFRLTAALWPALKAANGARVIALSSRGHRYSDVRWDDPDFARADGADYTPQVGYGQSKTANILFALALDARGAAHGVRAFSVHPGMILDTDLSRHMDRSQLSAMGVMGADGKAIIDPERRMKTIAMGAATSVWCATSPRLDGLGGLYCEDCDVSTLLPVGTDPTWGSPGHPIQTGVMAYAVDPAAAERLWALSEGWTGLTLD